MNNSNLIVKTLEQAGVRWVFGIPSGPVLPFIEALRGSPVGSCSRQRKHQRLSWLPLSAI
jgi:thiamine pyrophosphate-dependent acetolactate synthase large subunit-like protein